ncbi:hypothetical protein OsJ_06721 [Oryza sativa Japonica Group]|uniref:Uncharacterized protein n=1 Tax=Oryza sativa subsp. japonica TaxID=39947 RepID=B9EZZ4_ORYSJ|nr:hypothetical protein OsJ_06721 [Oryza sativa Japonica Group]
MAAPIPTLFPQPQATTAANASEGPLLSPPSATKAPSSNGRHHVLAESEAAAGSSSASSSSRGIDLGLSVLVQVKHQQHLHRSSRTWSSSSSHLYRRNRPLRPDCRLEHITAASSASRSTRSSAPPRHLSTCARRWPPTQPPGLPPAWRSPSTPPSVISTPSTPPARCPAPTPSTPVHGVLVPPVSPPPLPGARLHAAGRPVALRLSTADRHRLCAASAQPLLQTAAGSPSDLEAVLDPSPRRAADLDDGGGGGAAAEGGGGGAGGLGDGFFSFLFGDLAMQG